MSDLPSCPKCRSTFTYEDGALLVCPECAHEWSLSAPANADETGSSEAGLVVRDANGTLLKDGDAVVVAKDLKVKGAASALKVGTRIKSIRLVEGDHDIDCWIDGFGAMKLKSGFVKRA
jgi:protein PhnA